MKSVLFILLFFPLMCAGQVAGKSDIYVWKTLKFGDTEKEYKAVIKNNKDILSDRPFTFDPEYNKAGKIMGLFIMSEAFVYDGLNPEVFVDGVLLKVLIATKYGEGTKIAEVPTVSEVPKGTIAYFNEWEYGKKKITVGIYRSENDVCYAICYIFHTDMHEKHEKTSFSDDANKF